MRTFTVPLLATTLSPLLALAGCTANTTSTVDLQNELQDGGPGHILSLCAGQTYSLSGVLNYTAANQEISTEGYPTDDSRATLLINGFNITSAVNANMKGLDGVKLRNVQINGNRGNEPIYTAPNANIEFGGANSNQLIEHVRSYDPRGWSCLHVAEGPLACRNVTIQNNDLGPCGSDAFQQWADGISLSCQSSLVQGNTIVDATDGGIVIFGAPYSTIRNNHIHVKTRTMLGGINMVDVLPWKPEGNYSGVTVENNLIEGGFATDFGNDTMGKNNASAMIKIGMAIGPRIWFSDNRYGTNQTTGATIQNNMLSGAFAFGIAVSGAKDVVIQNNSFTGNVSFIGTYGPNCTASNLTPHSPTPLLAEDSRNTNVQFSVPSVSDRLKTIPGISAFAGGTGNGLTCFMPPSGAIAWPYGGGGLNAEPTTTDGGSSTTSPATTSDGAGTRAQVGPGTGATVGMTIMIMGMIMGVVLI